MVVFSRWTLFSLRLQEAGITRHVRGDDSEADQPYSNRFKVSHCRRKTGASQAVDFRHPSASFGIFPP
jgi:hypothetical protein